MKFQTIQSIFTLIIYFFFVTLLFSTLSSAEVNINSSSIPTTTTIAFMADARPLFASNLSVLTDDFNQIIPQSPTGHVNAVILIGDMDPIDRGIINSTAAYKASSAKNIPSFYVVGNHELENTLDLTTIKTKFAAYSFAPNPGPEGTRNTTYSFDVGDIHIVVLNEYWDGNNDNKCSWYTPSNGSNVDDGCFKYNKTYGDGGYIPDALYNWLQNDLTRNTKDWTIVVGHEPLYPQGTNHVGDSLDQNKTNRNRLENLLKLENVTAFIGGHTHQSSLTIIDDIFHADAGAMGAQTHRNTPPNNKFASIIYTTVNSSGYFSISRVFENPTWNNPSRETLMKSVANSTKTDTIDIFGNFFWVILLLVLIVLMLLKRVIKHS